MICFFDSIKYIYALEPDKKTFKRLVRYSEAEDGGRVIPINSAAWSKDSVGTFFGSGNRNSTAVATASYEHSEDQVSMVKIDSVTDKKVDYIKYDVEGAEREALIGSHETIEKYKPTLLVSLYHRSRDIFELINYVRDKYPDYQLYLRRLRCLPAWEIDLICVKNREEICNEKT
jgi:FkbM family methyltransferase